MVYVAVTECQAKLTQVFAYGIVYLHFYEIKTNFGNPHLTLKEGPKVKSDHTKRFPAHDFLDFGLPFQSSRTNNKRVISTFKFGYPRLTMMEGPRSNPTTAIDSQHMILCTILV